MELSIIEKKVLIELVKKEITNHVEKPGRLKKSVFINLYDKLQKSIEKDPQNPNNS